MSNKLPKAVGPYAAYRNAGPYLFTSGQLPLDPETNEFSGQDVSSQTRQCLENLKTILEINEGSLQDVIKTTVYLHSMDDFAQVNEVYAQYFQEEPPARETVAVVQLPLGVPVEISCIAIK